MNFKHISKNISTFSTTILFKEYHHTQLIREKIKIFLRPISTRLGIAYRQLQGWHGFYRNSLPLVILFGHQNERSRP